MTKIVISGASGDLGRKITALLAEKIPATDLTLVTRSPEKLADRAAQGMSVFPGDYDDTAALELAYSGCDTLMLISGLDVTKRIPQHRNAIESAKKAGVKHIVYTSVAGIHPRNPTLSASDHIQSEADLRNSGLGYTIMRNATYSEIFPTIAAGPALASGVWEQVAGEGRLAPVSKHDIARCAAACLLDPEYHNGAVYEISGPDLVSFRDITAMTAETYGVPIRYEVVTEEQRFAHFDAMGVPRTYDPEQAAHPDAHMWASDEMVSADVAFGQNFHAILTAHVEFITGQKPISLKEVFVACKGKEYDEV